MLSEGPKSKLFLGSLPLADVCNMHINAGATPYWQFTFCLTTRNFMAIALYVDVNLAWDTSLFLAFDLCEGATHFDSIYVLSLSLSLNTYYVQLNIVSRC